MARERRGRWFDPELVKAFCSLVAASSESIASEMGMSAPQRIRLRRAALLHEWEVVKRHPYFTYEILARVPVFSEFAYDASCHHERIDGRGYHRGVPGDGLSTSARIMATADIFDALSAARPYRGAMPLDQVLKIIQEGRGTQLCPATVDALLAYVGRVPRSGPAEVQDRPSPNPPYVLTKRT